MNKIIVLVDMDGVIAEFDEHFDVWVRAMGYGFDWSIFTSWSIEKAITGCENHKHQKAVFAKVLNDPKFWLGIPVFPEAQEHLGKIHADPRFHVKICTNPWGTQQIYKDVKIEWMNRFFPYIPTEDIIFSGSEKWLIPGEVIIDDKPEVLERCAPDKVTIKSNRPYNRETKSTFEFTRWSQVPEHLDKIHHWWSTVTMGH